LRAKKAASGVWRLHSWENNKDFKGNLPFSSRAEGERTGGWLSLLGSRGAPGGVGCRVGLFHYLIDRERGDGALDDDEEDGGRRGGPNAG